jgi:hypothetical protein
VLFSCFQNAYSELIKALVDLRKEQSFKVGDYFTAIRDNNVVSFVREFDGETGYNKLPFATSIIITALNTTPNKNENLYYI